MKRIVVCGAGGFIGGHLVRRLKRDGHWVRGLDIKQPEFAESEADDFVLYDLRERHSLDPLFNHIDEVYQLAADMGGAGYVFTGEHDADIMRNNALINATVLDACVENKVPRVFYSSSACVYPQALLHPSVIPAKANVDCQEWTAYPANPDSEYGWEKLFSERLYLSYARNYALQVRIGRYHNIFGPLGTWKGGREKAPAALCRKVAEADNFSGEIEIWGDGSQTRSFCWIDDCIEGTVRLMSSDWSEPLNIGSAEMVTIDHMANLICAVAGKTLTIKHVDGPRGVQGRNSNNNMISKVLGWAPSTPLHVGLGKLYPWIEQNVRMERDLDEILSND